MKNDFNFDEIYPWSEKKPSNTSTQGKGDGPPQPPDTTPTGTGDGGGGEPRPPTTTPTGTGGDGRPQPTKPSGSGGGKKPTVTPTPKLSKPKPRGNKPYTPQNLDDHIEIGDEPKEVLPTGDRPNAPMNDGDREKKRRQVAEEIKQRSLERSRGRGGDPLWPDTNFEYDNVPTVNYKAELKNLLQNLKVVYSDKLHPSSYSYGYAEYKTQKLPEKLSIAVALDTSGSVIDKAKEFLNEAYKIAMAATKIEIYVILFTDGVYAKGFCKNKAELQGFLSNMQKAVESGGTHMSPVARVVSEAVLQRKLSRNSAVIYLTDGAIEADCVLSTVVKANYIYVVQGGDLGVLLPLKKKYNNLKIAWINI
jgi:predicted metal-dependent peptidase